MKHAEARSIVHNVADSLASGIGLLIGAYSTDVFEEARHSPTGALTVDFLNGRVVEGTASNSLSGAVALYRDAMAKLIVDAGGCVTDWREAKARFWSDEHDVRFSITIADAAERRSTTEYAGWPGRRVRVTDELGRIRPMSSVR